MELPMSLSMHAASVPVFRQMLAALAGVLAKAETHASERKIDPVALLQARLFPDMFPLTRQVWIATDFARGTVARLAGDEPPKWDDTEATFADLIARVERAHAAVTAYTAAQIDGSETRSIVRPVRGQPHTFNGLDYLLRYALPNFYFHSATAYGILRSSGVELGKVDFIGALD